MTKSSKSRLGLGALMVVVGLATGALATGAEASPRSLPMHGSFTSHFATEGCTSPIGVCQLDRFRGTLNGPAEAVVYSFAPTPDPAVREADFTLVVHDSRGDLSCRAQAVNNTAAGGDSDFAYICEVTGGTGRYTGASGYVLAHGAIPPGETEYRGTFDGKVVLPS